MEKKESMLANASSGLGEMEEGLRATVISPSGQTRGLAGSSVAPDPAVREKAVRRPFPKLPGLINQRQIQGIRRYTKLLPEVSHFH